ncbi:hypothetical protein LUW75_10955 [Streptomyces sp. MRC013]|uniref:hypothetical protein n=1 Tax=Streptomyces sp. MRC013 TaxID=2898276 RepID=UPI00202651EE|nr:hypothetical protein [Streptomyces sp. MRC013]URM90432.1 hypothetical protein LUW75_10955 [Streptomyces sp. MRC013]
MPLPRWCAACQRVIDGPADTYSPDSGSGAAPAVYFHPGCHPSRRPLSAPGPGPGRAVRPR